MTKVYEGASRSCQLIFLGDLGFDIIPYFREGEKIKSRFHMGDMESDCMQGWRIHSISRRIDICGITKRYLTVLQSTCMRIKLFSCECFLWEIQQLCN